jgi:hypothetical protein
MLAARNRGPAEALAVLNCHRLPARLNSTETCVLLGFQEHDIPILIAAKLLSPLGKPVANAPKYFAATEILALAQDLNWLNKATKAVALRWRAKNGRGQQADQKTNQTYEHSDPT